MDFTIIEINLRRKLKYKKVRNGGKLFGSILIADNDIIAKEFS